MHTTENRAFCSVNLHGFRDLLYYVGKVARFQRRIGLRGFCAASQPANILPRPTFRAEEACQLGRIRRDCAAAHHRITLPYDNMVSRFHRIDMRWEVLIDLVGAVSAYDGDFARYSIGIHHW